MPHFKKGGNIINTASVTAYQGSPELLDYSSTKGAIVAFTRSLSQALAKKKIRVNAVARASRKKLQPVLFFWPRMILVT
jgi:NAD(P)-dependent dehydrogenase (short-subunit alcohol dehydrogenase family)